jgi:hypothetical protein
MIHLKKPFSNNAGGLFCASSLISSGREAPEKRPGKILKKLKHLLLIIYGNYADNIFNNLQFLQISIYTRINIYQLFIVDAR